MNQIFAHRVTARRITGGSALIFRAFRLIALSRQRSQLAELSDAQLEDIGLTRAEAEAEASRPVWDVPAGWRR